MEWEQAYGKAAEEFDTHALVDGRSGVTIYYDIELIKGVTYAMMKMLMYADSKVRGVKLCEIKSSNMNKLIKKKVAINPNSQALRWCIKQGGYIVYK